MVVPPTDDRPSELHSNSLGDDVPRLLFECPQLPVFSGLIALTPIRRKLKMHQVTRIAYIPARRDRSSSSILKQSYLLLSRRRRYLIRAATRSDKKCVRCRRDSPPSATKSRWSFKVFVAFADLASHYLFSSTQFFIDKLPNRLANSTGLFGRFIRPLINRRIRFPRI